MTSKIFWILLALSASATGQNSLLIPTEMNKGKKLVLQKELKVSPQTPHIYLFGGSTKVDFACVQRPSLYTPPFPLMPDTLIIESHDVFEKVGCRIYGTESDQEFSVPAGTKFVLAKIDSYEVKSCHENGQKITTTLFAPPQYSCIRSYPNDRWTREEYIRRFCTEIPEAQKIRTVVTQTVDRAVTYVFVKEQEPLEGFGIVCSGPQVALGQYGEELSLALRKLHFHWE